MAHADALSRAPITTEEKDLDAVLAERYEVCTLMTERERVLICQTADSEIKELVRRISQLPEGADEKYEMVVGLLYRKFRNRSLFVMPKSMRKSLLVTAHDLSGHPAVDGIMNNLLQDFWFADMKRYVKQHLYMCFECLLVKNPRGKRPGLLPTHRPTTLRNSTYGSCRTIYQNGSWKPVHSSVS